MFDSKDLSSFYSKKLSLKSLFVIFRSWQEKKNVYLLCSDDDGAKENYIFLCIIVIIMMAGELNWIIFRRQHTLLKENLLCLQLKKTRMKRQKKLRNDTTSMTILNSTFFTTTAAVHNPILRLCAHAHSLKCKRKIEFLFLSWRRERNKS